MDNFFTRVKERTTEETWRRGTYGGDQPRACLGGLMGWRNTYWLASMTAEDRKVSEEAYVFANREIALTSPLFGSVEHWNDRLALGVAHVHQMLDVLAEAWEEKQQAQAAAKTWAEQVEREKEQDRVERGWLSIERSMEKADPPTLSRFADYVEGWLRRQPIEEREKADA